MDRLMPILFIKQVVMSDFSFRDNGDFLVGDQGGGYSTPDDAPNFDWGNFAGSIIGIIPVIVDATNGTTPPTIIYPAQEYEEEDDTIWIIAALIIITIIIATIIIVKNK